MRKLKFKGGTVDLLSPAIISLPVFYVSGKCTVVICLWAYFMVTWWLHCPSCCSQLVVIIIEF